MSLKNPSFKNDFKEQKASVNKKKVNFEDSKAEILTSEKETPDKKEQPTLCLDTKLDDGKSLSVNSLASLTENIAYIDEGRDITDRTSMAADVVSEVAETIPKVENTLTSSSVKDDVFADVHIQNIIKKFDEQKPQEPLPSKPKIFPRANLKKQELPERPDAHKKPAVPARNPNTTVRGRLDKSHSTPAYDLTPDDEAGVEKFVVESKVVEKKVETETIITTSSKTIKYILETEKPPKQESAQKTEDVPPKPPPRTFPVLETQKKEIEPPKLLTPIVEQSKPPPPEPRHFDFPEAAKQSNENVNEVKNFEPKVASTPTLKLEKMDFGESEVKAADIGKTVNDTKVSPTNSVVRAMISSNKNKSGNKKKNTLVASK